MQDQAPAEAREFAVAFRKFIDWAVQAAEHDQRNEVAALIGDLLGSGRAEHSVVSRDLPVFEHVNLLAAIDGWSARPGRDVEVRGILLPPDHSLMLQQLVSAEICRSGA